MTDPEASCVHPLTPTPPAPTRLPASCFPPPCRRLQTLGDVLFYEVLDMPLPEFEKLMHFKVRHAQGAAGAHAWEALGGAERAAL